MEQGQGPTAWKTFLRCTDSFTTCIILGLGHYWQWRSSSTNYEAENVIVWSRQQHSINRNTINNGPACPSPVGYLDAINACGKAESPEEVMERHSGGVLRPLFSQLLCVLESSAPVEHVFSQSGLIVWPNQAKVSNSLLESLVFLKCNLTLWTVNWWTGNFDYYCSCLDSFICCCVLLALFNT